MPVRLPGRLSRAAIRVDRAVTELRRGRPVRLRGARVELVVLALETTLPDGFPVCGDHATADIGPRLILSSERAAAAGWHLAGGGSASALPLVLTLGADVDAAALTILAGLEAVDATGSGRRRGATPDASWMQDADTAPLAVAAVELARLARLVPALLARRVATAPGAAGCDDDDVLQVSVDDLTTFVAEEALGLRRIAEAPVPLAGHESSRFVLFRESTADFEHVAIVVGEPDLAAPVPVRMHSSCLTGDLFGSLRCDCGEQLRGGIARLEQEGGGVLLYLAQEGRGIGLANKLRAYARQDAGLDTIDADRYLGFRGDERRFAIAARMLRELGISQVRLLTNNPAKIAALRSAGLAVVDRIPISGSVNRFNARYLTTKRERAGHLIEMPPAAGDSSG